MNVPKQIVAEVSKTWVAETPPDSETIGDKFELVIQHNRKRGYELLSWHFVSFQTSCDGIDGIHESMVAVFEYNPNSVDLSEET